MKKYLQFIKESPDELRIYKYRNTGEQITLRWQSGRAFGYYLGYMLVSPLGYSHPDVIDKLTGHFGHDKMDAKDDFVYSGRIWEDKRVISFWEYPNNKEKLKDIIIDLEKELNNVRKLEGLTPIQIWDDDQFLIEIVKNKQGEIKTNLQYDWKNNGKFPFAELIPLQSYETSEDVDKLVKKWHLMNWKEKQQNKSKVKFPGFGSYRTAWDSERPLNYRQALYQEKKKFFKK